MDDTIRKYMAAIGRIGGARSRRKLGADQARRMVRVVEQLMKHGDRRAWEKGASLCR